MSKAKFKAKDKKVFKVEARKHITSDGFFTGLSIFSLEKIPRKFEYDG